MKIITSSYTRLAEIECACCHESHTVTLTLDNDGELYFEFWETTRPLKQRIRDWFDIRLHTKSYISGAKKFGEGILIRPNQLLQLRDVLVEAGIKEIPITDYTIPKVTCSQMIRPTRSSKKEKKEWTVYTLYDSNEIIFYQEDDETGEYVLGYHLHDSEQAHEARSSKINKFINGCWEASLDSKEPGKFLWVINKILE
jgi:hypothetical protein